MPFLVVWKFIRSPLNELSWNNRYQFPSHLINNLIESARTEFLKRWNIFAWFMNLIMKKIFRLSLKPCFIKNKLFEKNYCRSCCRSCCCSRNLKVRFFLKLYDLMNSILRYIFYFFVITQRERVFSYSDWKWKKWIKRSYLHNVQNVNRSRIFNSYLYTE